MAFVRQKKKTRRQETAYDKAAAYHEAGHTVVALLRLKEHTRAKYPVRHIAINADHSGTTQLSKLRWPKEGEFARLAANDQMMALLAGSIAADLAMKHKRVFNAFGAHADYVEVKELWKSLTPAGETAPAVLRDSMLQNISRMKGYARKDLRAHWPAVEAIAIALLEKRTLTGKQAYDLMVAATPAQSHVR